MNWLLKNLWLKIIAFVMGLILWIHVATEKTYNYDLRLPITEVMVKPGLALSKEPPDSLLVTVSADGKQLLRYRWRRQGVRINASQYQAGRYTMTLSTMNTFLVNQTDEVTLDEVISPISIPLEIDAQATEEVDIRPQLEIMPDDGFAIGRQIEIEPPQATVIGPRSLLPEIDRIDTEERLLEGLRSTVTIRLALLPPPRWGFRLAPDSVTVTIPVVPVKTRVFEDIPIIVLNAPPDSVTEAQPGAVSLQITGPPTEIDLLNRNALSASVDYRAADSMGRARVRVESPPKFTLKDVSVDTIQIITLPSDTTATEN
ncbi:hypothetical protein GF377_04735 [candidate division GN15 bacterium]|nr:hypothetical protein [candidate division GN15 bacterium]